MIRRGTFKKAILAFVVCILPACGGDGGTGPGGQGQVPVVAGITLSRNSITFDALGAQETLTATVRDQNGSVMSGQAVTWSSSTPAVGVSEGLVTALRNGSGTVTASVGSITTRADVSVQQVAREVVISTPSSRLMTGTRSQLRAEPRDRLGRALENFSLAWTASNTSVVSVHGSGLITAVRPGSAQVTATSGTVSGSVAVTVESPPLNASSLAQATGTVGIPQGVDPASVWVLSPLGGGGSLTPAGGFTIGVVRDANTTLMAMNGGELLGLAVVAPGAATGGSTAIEHQREF